MQLLTTLVLATEEAGAEESLNILPETAELVYGFIAFAILFAVIWRVALPGLNKALEERGARIQGQLEEAEATRTEAEEVKRRYEAQLADARNQAGEIVEEARKQGERLRADVLAKAEDEAAQIVARAREDAEGTRTRLVTDLRAQVASASVDLAGRIVQRELDPAQHRALVDQYISQLSGLN